MRYQLFAQMTTRAFGKYGVFAEQFHAQLKAVVRLAVFANAKVAGGHAADFAVIGVKHFGRGETGEDFNAQRFGLFGQPFGESTQADDVIAVVVEAARNQPLRRAAR